ncbi:MAG: methyltransferase domain-containing protein [Streptosporangiales bacterium]|nr:methyltransferase domain-containing protein [Streptosporangiales bacterium]
MATDPPPAADRSRRQAAQAAAFDEIGARYDEAFPHKEGQVDATDWLIAHLPPGATVLDVGCGTGVPTARRLLDAGHVVTGVDISPGMLALARENVPEADLRQLDILDLDESLGTFDAAVAFFSLLMLPRGEIPTALRRVHDLLAPGGLLVLAMVEADLDDVTIPFLGSDVRVSGYARDDLRDVLEDNGFDVDDLRDLTYAPATDGAPPEVELFATCRRR